jgi:hypothetical protein
VAVLAGVQDRTFPYKWAKPDGPVPGDESYRRLQAAHRAWTLIRGADDDHVARTGSSEPTLGWGNSLRSCGCKREMFLP